MRGFYREERGRGKTEDRKPPKGEEDGIRLVLHNGEGKNPVTLTDEVAESSYGIPVIAVGGSVYGPGDLIPSEVFGGPKGSQPWTTGETLVRNRADRQGVSGDPLVRLFLAAAR